MVTCDVPNPMCHFVQATTGGMIRGTLGWNKYDGRLIVRFPPDAVLQIKGEGSGSFPAYIVLREKWQKEDYRKKRKYLFTHFYTNRRQNILQVLYYIR